MIPVWEQVFLSVDISVRNIVADSGLVFIELHTLATNQPDEPVYENDVIFVCDVDVNRRLIIGVREYVDTATPEGYFKEAERAIRRA